MKRAGRRIVLGFEGLRIPDELVAFARRFGLGGLILFRRNCPDAGETAELIRDARSRLASADPGWSHPIFVDQEGGRVERVRDGVPHLPPAQELGRGGTAAVEEAARLQSTSLRVLGFDVNLAPVCDVLQAGESGAIGDRSFGSHPQSVGSLAAAFVKGCLQGGVTPCAKHFPGHGGARVDSHEALPSVEKSEDEWAAVDLPPFQAAIRAGVPLIMAAHVVYPAFSSAPATLCRTWLTRVLRGRLGFEGAVVSDDLEMGALASLGSAASVALRAARAGCDLLLYGRMLRPGLDVWPVAEALERDLPSDDGSAFEERVGRAFAWPRG